VLLFSRVAFADLATLNFDLQSLPAQSVISSATLFMSQSSDIQVLVNGSNVFDPNRGCIAASGFGYQTVPCPGNPFTNIGYISEWTFGYSSPYLISNQYDFEIYGAGFPGGPWQQFPSTVQIDPQFIPVDGTYRVSIKGQSPTGQAFCQYGGDIYCGIVPVPVPFYQVDGTANGTLDVQYSVDGVVQTAEFSAETSFSYATPEPGSYRPLLFAAFIALIGVRAYRRREP
jgi:hypothetical protein